MRRVVQKKIFYVCSTCRTRYSNKKEALRCENRVRENKIFRVGDAVQNIEPRTCQMRQKNYIFSGRVAKILGPRPSDSEYELKWLGGKTERVKGHVFEYEVKFVCPHCDEERKERYYAPELKAICR